MFDIIYARCNHEVPSEIFGSNLEAATVPAILTSFFLTAFLVLIFNISLLLAYEMEGFGNQCALLRYNAFPTVRDSALRSETMGKWVEEDLRMEKRLMTPARRCRYCVMLYCFETFALRAGCESTFVVLLTSDQIYFILLVA